MPEQFLHGVQVVEILDGQRPIQTVRSSVIGIIGTAPAADVAKFPLNTPIALTGPRAAEGIGATGTLKDGLDAIYDQAGTIVVMIRVEEGADEAATIANVVGDATDFSGVHGFMAASSQVMLSPRIIVAPGFTHQRLNDAANPVVAELKGIAQKLRAVVFVDAPSTTDAAAITAAGEAGSDRIYVCDPFVLAFSTEAGENIAQPSSARFAGVQARVDNELGFWFSLSNKVINGITGIARPIGFNMSDPGTQSNILNAAKVGTIVFKDGFRTWGNRGTGAEPLTAFLCVRRTMDIIEDSIEDAFLWAVDKPFSAQLLLDIEESINSYIRRLTRLGATLGGTVWLDKELNTAATLKAGKLYIDADIEPPAPAEHITIRIHRNDGYYTELLDAIAA